MLCFVSIGSNIEREQNVRRALAALREQFGPLLISSVYETKAVGFDGAPFYNLVLAFATDNTAREVARSLAHMEQEQGRLRNRERFAPRTLDLDLLLYGDHVIRENGLTLPRPEVARHAFVLEPLAEIAPDLRHPESGQTYAQLWQDVGGDRSAARVSLDLES